MAQTHQRLEAVYAQLNTLREDSIQAKRRAAILEETSAHFQAQLSQANAERKKLHNFLQQAATQVDRVNSSSNAIRLLESRLAGLEALLSKFEDAKRTAEQAEAYAAKSESKVGELRHRLKAMQAELETHHQASLRVTSEAEGFKRQTTNLKAALERGQQARNALEKQLSQAKSQITQLKEASLERVQQARDALEKQLNQAKSQITQLKEASLKAKESLPKLAHATIAYPPQGPKARDYLIRTIAFEAGGENELGKAAVAHVVLNRVRSGKWGSSVEDVVTSPWQFEPWMTRRKELEKLHPFDPRFQKAARIADAVLAGDMPDPTAGATHFLNPVVVRQRRGGSLPLWARRKGQPIGRHVFYAPDNRDEVPASADATRVSAGPPARVSSPAGPG
jgi:spore germination cell wall hydrolase CwlJ-like protein